MEVLKVTGIVVNSIDYREKDKLLSIFTLELGMINAVLKGVNTSKSKLKFAAMPFCFAEFMLANKNGFYTVTECSQIESFNNIIIDYNKTVVGFFILETTRIIIQNNIPNEKWFVSILKILKLLAYNNLNIDVFQIKYLLFLLEQVGYKLSLKFCNSCSMKILNDAYLDFETGEIKCPACCSSECFKFSKYQYGLLKLIDNCSFSNLDSIKVNNINELKILKSTLIKNVEYRFGKKLKTNIN